MEHFQTVFNVVVFISLVYLNQEREALPGKFHYLEHTLDKLKNKINNLEGSTIKRKKKEIDKLNSEIISLEESMIKYK